MSIEQSYTGRWVESSMPGHVKNLEKFNNKIFPNQFTVQTEHQENISKIFSEYNKI